MSNINILDFATANLIAAGEVVERPASVVKELVENSIDAGASKINVEIKNGGVSMIRVSDNGCGMSEDDLPRCILRHATSKISCGEDLSAIGTLGFRGEALAATAAVSKMRIVSKRKSDPVAHSINVNYGVCSTVSECGAADGTTVTVSELFSNVPARRKFLKADKTEAAAVASICEKIALSSPEISFTLTSDGTRKFSTSGDGVLRNVIYALFGRQFANEMIEVKGAVDGINVYGCAAPPILSRPNRAMELFFINGRYVRSPIMSSALEAAMQSYTPAERFPVAVIFLALHPSLVDVNVHPSKAEVKFSSERPIFDAVYYAVRSSMTENTKRPELEAVERKTTPSVSPFIPVTDEFTKTEISQVTAFDKPAEQARTVRSPSYFEQPISAPPVFTSPVYGEPLENGYGKDETKETEVLPWRYIGEAFDTYLFVEQGDDVLIIDKHAAHERLNFEELKEKMKNKEKTSQKRMVPVTVDLTPEEADAAEEYASDLSDAGFEFTQNGKIAEITLTPGDLSDREAARLFVYMLGSLAEGKEAPGISRDTLFERALYQASCKMSIKGGQKNDVESLKALVKRLLESPSVTYCPHGRPVAFRMSKAAMEKRFGRT